MDVPSRQNYYLLMSILMPPSLLKAWEGGLVLIFFSLLLHFWAFLISHTYDFHDHDLSPAICSLVYDRTCSCVCTSCHSVEKMKIHTCNKTFQMFVGSWRLRL